MITRGDGKNMFTNDMVELLIKCCYMLIVCNSSMNFLVYVATSNTFRQGYKEILLKIFRCARYDREELFDSQISRGQSTTQTGETGTDNEQGTSQKQNVVVESISAQLDNI